MLFEAATEWNCPETFPDLSKAKYIAIDLETRDPDLKLEDPVLSLVTEK